MVGESAESEGYMFNSKAFCKNINWKGSYEVHVFFFSNAT